MTMERIPMSKLPRSASSSNDTILLLSFIATPTGRYPSHWNKIYQAWWSLYFLVATYSSCGDEILVDDGLEWQ
jgi:hypothetical protein